MENVICHVGYKVVERLTKTAIANIQNPQPGDCLHLVTHSWGTVILLTNQFRLVDVVARPMSQTVFSLLQGGDAHGSYWHSDKVAREIASFLKKPVARDLVAPNFQ